MYGGRWRNRLKAKFAGRISTHIAEPAQWTLQPPTPVPANSFTEAGLLPLPRSGSGPLSSLLDIIRKHSILTTADSSLKIWWSPVLGRSWTWGWQTGRHRKHGTIKSLPETILKPILLLHFLLDEIKLSLSFKLVWVRVSNTWAESVPRDVDIIRFWYLCSWYTFKNIFYVSMAIDRLIYWSGKISILLRLSI